MFCPLRNNNKNKKCLASVSQPGKASCRASLPTSPQLHLAPASRQLSIGNNPLIPGSPGGFGPTAFVGCSPRREPPVTFRFCRILPRRRVPTAPEGLVMDTQDLDVEEPSTWHTDFPQKNRIIGASRRIKPVFGSGRVTLPAPRV